MSFDIDNYGKGALFSMSPSWSETDTDTTRYVWNSSFLDDSIDNNASSDGISFSGEIGYGFETMDGSTLTTPYSAFEQTVDHGNKFEVGSRIATKSGLKFEFGGHQKHFRIRECRTKVQYERLHQLEMVLPILGRYILIEGKSWENSLYSYVREWLNTCLELDF